MLLRACRAYIDRQLKVGAGSRCGNTGQVFGQADHPNGLFQARPGLNGIYAGIEADAVSFSAE